MFGLADRDESWSAFFYTFASSSRGALKQRAEIIPLEPDTGNADVGRSGHGDYWPDIHSNNMKKIVFFMIGIIGLTMPGFCQSEISGKIVDEKNVAIPGAQILVHESFRGAISDASGEFSIARLNSGSVKLEVHHLGYAESQQYFDLNRDTSLLIVLKMRTLVSDEIVVLGTRASRKDPVSYTSVTREELNESNGIQDIPYLISMTPSVVQTSDAGNGIGYSGLRIRGTDPSRTNVTINGIPYNDSESHDVYWVNIPDVVSSVESIQIQRGVGTSTNGAGVFGANINIQTNQLNPEPYARVQATVGSYNTHKASVQAGTGLLNNQFSFDMRLSDIHSDGYIDRAFSDLSSWYASAGWYKKKSLLKATVFSGKEITYQAWGGVPGDSLLNNRRYNPYTYENEVDDYQQTHYQLHWSYALNTSLNWNLALHYTSGSGFYEQFKEGEDLEDYLLKPLSIGGVSITETDLIRRKWLDNDFFGAVYSINYSKDRLDVTLGGGSNSYIGDHFGKIIWAQYSSNGGIDHEWYRSRGKKTDHSIYLRSNYGLSKNLFLFGDIQYRLINYGIEGFDDDLRNINQDHLYNFVNPKAGWKWMLPKEQQLFGSLSLASREPKRSNYTDASPDQEILPENLIDTEVGYEKRFNAALLSVNTYLMYYQDQLVYTGEINDVGAPVMMNVHESYRAGIEMSFAWKISDNLDWQINSTVSKNKILDFIEYVDDWDTWSQRSNFLGTTDLAMSPSLILNHTLAWEPIENLKLRWESKYVSKQYIDNTSSDSRSIDPYWINNLSAQWSIEIAGIGDLSFFIQCLNVLNEEYESHAWVYNYYSGGNRALINGYYPQADRHFLLGIILDF